MADTSNNSLKLLGPWRIRFQWLTSLVVLLLPWLQVGGESALRIDVSSLSIHLFGSILRIEELYLFLAALLIFILSFFLLTLLFGRLWCGWACPQTTLSDIAEWLAIKLGCRLGKNGGNGANGGDGIVGTAVQKTLWHLSLMFLALVVASNLVWYFIEPLRFFQLLFDLALPTAVTITLLLVSATVYLDLTFLRRLFCKEVCPYGRFQSALADDATMVLHRPEDEEDRCLECGACVNVCPMGIDIREGYQIECINCGRCLDACRQVMVIQDEPGLIHYHLGTEKHNWRMLVNRRSITLAGVILFLSVLLIVGITSRKEATIKIAHSHTAASKILSDGNRVSFFNVWINNRGMETHRYSLKVKWGDGVDSDSPLTLKGSFNDIAIAAGKNRRVDIALVAEQFEEVRTIKIYLLQDGEIVADASVQL